MTYFRSEKIQSRKAVTVTTEEKVDKTTAFCWPTVERHVLGGEHLKGSSL